MSIFNRLTRLCRADMHGLMDKIEDRRLLLKQHLREMEEELERKRGELDGLRLRIKERVREREKYARECARMEQDLELALQRDRDDIGRALIRRLRPLDNHRKDLEAHISSLEGEAESISLLLERQKLEYESLKLKAAEQLREMERNAWSREGRLLTEPGTALVPGADSWAEPPEVEVELELIQRKEKLQMTTGPNGSNQAEG